MPEHPPAPAEARGEHDAITWNGRGSGVAEKFKGIDILRAIRSFDPCMPCTTHIYAGDQHITCEVNTCACGADD